jgi:HTH-type transcriptional regulator, sugar sensing transcriptional regulator
MPDDTERILAEIGLSDGERKVYLALLELGEATSGPIADKSGISASKVYQVVERLMKKGLVGGVSVSGVKRFKATHPRAILDYLKTREEEAKVLRESTQKLLPVLEAKFKDKETETEVQLYRGVKSVRNSFYGMLGDLKKGESYKVIGANYGGLSWTRAFFRHYHEERAARGVNAKLLFQRTFGIPDATWKGADIRFLPWNFATPLQINVWKENTALVLLQEEPLVFTIKSKTIADSFTQYFETLWSQEVKTFKGVEGIKSIFLDMLSEPECLFLGGGGYMMDRDPAWFAKEFVPKVAAAKHRWKTLTAPERRGHAMTRLPFVEAKTLPPGDYPPNVIFIYGKKVASVLWEQEPIAFLIENESVANSYREYFNALWSQQIQTYKGKEGIQSLLLEALAEKELYFIGGGAYIPDRMTEWFKEVYIPKAISSGYRWKNLVLPRIRGHWVHDLPFVESRFLPPGDYPPSLIYIWGDCVANVVWEEEPVAFVLRNAKVAAGYRQYFEGLWANADPHVSKPLKIPPRSRRRDAGVAKQ